MSGWVCSHRRIWQNSVFQGNALRVGVWHWMLHKAAWKAFPFQNGREAILLQPGQLCVSQKQISQATGMTPQQVRTFFRELENSGQITRRKTGKRDVISICKYDDFHANLSSGNTPENASPTQEQRTKEQKKTINTSSSEETGAPARNVVGIRSATSSFWNDGKRMLSELNVPDPGALIGKLRKDGIPDDHILSTIKAACAKNPDGSVPYFQTRLEDCRGDRGDDIVQAVMKEVLGGDHDP